VLDSPWHHRGRDARVGLAYDLYRRHAGHHGLYHAYQVRAGQQEIYRTRAEDGALPPFWKYLDDAGKPCIVMDAFLDRQLPDSAESSSWNTAPGRGFSEPASTPRSLRAEILRRFGPYPAPEHTHVLTVPDPVGSATNLPPAPAARPKSPVGSSGAAVGNGVHHFR
jgi:hypothetical protein